MDLEFSHLGQTIDDFYKKYIPFSRASSCSAVNEVRLRCNFLLSLRRICSSLSAEFDRFTDSPCAVVLPSTNMMKFAKIVNLITYNKVAYIILNLNSSLCLPS